MPYINKTRRDDSYMACVKPATAGELNFWFTKTIIEYMAVKGESYQTYNDIMGALEGCKLELYRRKIAPYEDSAIERNGDVY